MFLWQLSPSILPVLRGVPSVYWAMTFKAVCPTGLKWLPRGAPCGVRAGTACLANGCITLTGFGPLMLQRALWRRRRGAFDAIVSCSHDVRRQLVADGIESHDVIWPGVRRETATTAARRTTHGHLRRPTHRGEGSRRPRARLRARARARAGCAALDRRCGSGRAGAARARPTSWASPSPSIMHGQLGGEALERTLDRGWVHAVPSRWPEPFGLTATEAMMRGTAVVASDIGGLAESVAARDDWPARAGRRRARPGRRADTRARRSSLRRAAGRGGARASARVVLDGWLETIPHLTPRDLSIAGARVEPCSAPMPKASETSSQSPATRPRRATTRCERVRGRLHRPLPGSSRKNAGEDFNGREIDAPTSFFLGVAVNPAADDLAYELERFQQKLEAGANSR